MSEKKAADHPVDEVKSESSASGAETTTVRRRKSGSGTGVPTVAAEAGGETPAAAERPRRKPPMAGLPAQTEKPEKVRRKTPGERAGAVPERPRTKQEKDFARKNALEAKVTAGSKNDTMKVYMGEIAQISLVSKKEEADLYGITDAVLTFEELEMLLNESGVTLPELGPDPDEGKRARFFPIEGGIIRSMDIENTGYHYLAVTGVENCMEALKEIEAGNLENCFVELSACEGSCINGPGIRHHHSSSTLLSETKVDTFAGPADFQTPAPFDLAKPMSFVGVHKQMPGERAIKEILAQMGKTTPEQELNCGCCGYNTCREKAIAVYQGKADLSMCLPFLKEKAETFSGYVINSSPNGIFVLDEDLCVQQINRAACQLFNLKSPNDILGSPIVRILNPSDYLAAMTTGVPVREKKHFLAEYNKYVAESIVYDREYHIIFSIMRDITREEEQETARTQLQTKTVEITNQVIEKQMRVVQEIASLLGETTAETKIALTQLKDTLQS